MQRCGLPLVTADPALHAAQAGVGGSNEHESAFHVILPKVKTVTPPG